MKAFVTGADGLLGSNLVRELLAAGHQVTAFVLPASKSPTLDGLEVKTVRGDLLGDREVLKDSMAGADAVFHCAAITDQWADSDLMWSVNYEGTKRVLEALTQTGVKKLVYVSSASIYKFGTIDNPGDETAGFAPEYRGIAYMESKNKATAKVMESARDNGFEAMSVAPTFLLGPFDSGPSSGELIRQFIKRGLKFTAPGGRNFAYAPDVAKACVLAGEKGRSGEAYIAGGANLTYLDFFSRVAKIAGMAPPKVVLPKAVILAGGAAGSLVGKFTSKPPQINYKIARLSLYGTYYSPKKAVEELGMPQTPVEKGIEDSIASLKQYGHL